MDRPEVTARDVAVTAGYLLLGVVVTGIVSLGVLLASRPLQPLAYHAVYLRLGPGDATEFAILLHFLLAATGGLAVATLAGTFLHDRGADPRPVLGGVAAMAALLVAFVAASLSGLVGLLVALGWVLVVGVGVPALLWLRFGVRSGGLPAFVGGVPVVVLLLLLAGFGLGWGWGYVLSAERVPADAVGDAEVTDFSSVPEVREDLLSGDCSGTADGGEVCYLELRGYEHEVAAVRFLERNGVRCPYQGSGESPGSLLAEHEGTYYRVSCGGHGD